MVDLVLEDPRQPALSLDLDRLAADVATGGADARRQANELLASARKRLEYWEVPASDIAG